jgi:hypothetical protein
MTAKRRGGRERRGKSSGQDKLLASAAKLWRASARLVGQSSVTANAYVIRAGKTKHGINPRLRKEQFVQAAIAAEHPHHLPDNLNHTDLTKAVNRRLQSDPAFAVFRENYRHVKITRPTVIAALRALRRANS